MNHPALKLTNDELDAAKHMAVASKASLAEATSTVLRCRGNGVDPGEVAERAVERGVSPAAALDELLALEAAAGKVLSEPITIAEQRPPQQGDTLHLRDAKNKGERRLLKEIQAAVNARNAAMGQLARANRRIAVAEKDLRDAGMVTKITQGGAPPQAPGKTG